VLAVGQDQDERGALQYVRTQAQTLILVAEDGTEFTLDVDEALRAAVRQAAASPVRRVIEAGEVLRPKDIQSLIRQGATPEELVEVGGLEPDVVDRYAQPVLDERAYVAQRAQALKPGGEPDSPTLGEVATARLATRGVDPETIAWDAVRERTGWVASLQAVGPDGAITARWALDLPGNDADPLDEDAEWLTAPEMADAPIPRTGPLRQAGPPSAPLAAVRDVDDDGVPLPGMGPAPFDPPEGAAVALLDDLLAQRGLRQPVDPPFLATDPDAPLPNLPGPGARVLPMSPPPPSRTEPPAPPAPAPEGGQAPGVPGGEPAPGRPGGAPVSGLPGGTAPVAASGDAPIYSDFTLAQAAGHDELDTMSRRSRRSIRDRVTSLDQPPSGPSDQPGAAGPYPGQGMLGDDAAVGSVVELPGASGRATEPVTAPAPQAGNHPASGTRRGNRGTARPGASDSASPAWPGPVAGASAGLPPAEPTAVLPIDPALAAPGSRPAAASAPTGAPTAPAPASPWPTGGASPAGATTAVSPTAPQAGTAPEAAGTAAAGAAATSATSGTSVSGEPEGRPTEAQPTEPAAAPRRRTKPKRSSVPSWDEIVFGAKSDS
jgi:hypothetical protein